MSNEEKRHHFLVTGEIVFYDVDEDKAKSQDKDYTGPDVNALRVNGILITDTTTLPVASLGKAQQVLQANFFTRMEGQNLRVVDVVLTNFTYLGLMTQEEFHHNPEVMKPKERTPDLEEVVAEAASKKEE